MCKIVSSSNETPLNIGVMKLIMFQNNSEIKKENVLPLQFGFNFTNNSIEDMV